MKEQAIQKINKVGKAGHIIALICKIVLIIGLVACLSAMIAMFFVPKGMLTARTSGDADFRIDLSVIGKTLSQEDQDSINSGKTGYDGVAYIAAGGTEYDLSEIHATENDITVLGGSDETVLDFHDLSLFLFPVLINIISALACMIFTGRLCKAFRYCKTPFEENVITRLQQLAYSLIPWTVLSSLAKGTMDSIMDGKLHLYFNLNIGMLVTVLLVFLLVVVFKYGAVLQRESDETL